MAYQGAVLGPPVWNCHCADACMAARAARFDEDVFADDSNAWRALPADAAHEEANSQFRVCQSSLHEWGRANRVRFDADKEHFHFFVTDAARCGHF
eukprot:7832806-Pyramimonas_sp.AAC.1